MTDRPLPNADDLLEGCGAPSAPATTTTTDTQVSLKFVPRPPSKATSTLPDADALLQFSPENSPSLLPSTSSSSQAPSDESAQQRSFLSDLAEAIYPTKTVKEGGKIDENLEKLPDWSWMPEVHNLLSPNTDRALLGLASSVHLRDIEDIFKTRFGPEGVTVEKQGDYLVLTSPSDGRKYKWAPGFRGSDIPRTIAGMGVYTGGTLLAGAGAAAAAPLVPAALAGAVPASVLAAGGLLASGAAGAGALELAKGAGGGTPNAEGVTEGALLNLGLGVGGKLLRMGKNFIRGAAPEVGATAVEAGVPVLVPPEPPVLPPRPPPAVLQPRVSKPPPIAPPAPPADVPMPAPPPPSATIPALEAKGAQLAEGFGNRDVSQVDAAVRDWHNVQLQGYAKNVRAAYKHIDETIGTQGADASDSLAFIKNLEQEAGGPDKIPAWVKKIRRELTPEELEGGGSVPPTMGKLDEVQRRVGKWAGPKNPAVPTEVDQSVARGLFGPLKKDQLRSAQALNMGEELETARALARQQSTLRKKAAILFGPQTGEHLAGETLEGEALSQKALVGDLMPKTKASVLALSEGESADFIQRMKALPQDQRSDIIGSSLASAFGEVSPNGSLDLDRFAKWYEGVQANSVSRDALGICISPKVRQNLKDLYQVYQEIAKETSVGAAKKTEYEALKVSATSAIRREARQFKEALRQHKALVKEAADRFAEAKDQRLGANEVRRQEYRKSLDDYRQTKQELLQQHRAEMKVHRDAVNSAKKKAEQAAEEKANAYKKSHIYQKAESLAYWGGPIGYAGKVVTKIYESGAFQRILNNRTFVRVMDAAKMPASARAKTLEKWVSRALIGAPYLVDETPISEVK